MTRTTKPYRRFRARGTAEDVTGEDGLAELRALNEGGSGSGDAPPGGRRPPEPDLRERRPGRLERQQRRALQREGRSRWSFRGLGPGGWAARIAILFFVLLLGWAVMGYIALNGAVKEANSRISPQARAALDPAPGGMLGTPTNTLILGVDARPGEARSRADTILIMRTNPDTGRVSYLSIPRDWRVDLPVVGTQKINAAYYFGGAKSMINAVKRLTGVPINHIMIVRFGGFPKMVDALGGVTVTNSTALVDCPYEGGRTVSFPAGQIQLDGARALEFARVRKCDGDFSRALRQQAVVAGMKSKVLSPMNIWRAPWRGAGVVRGLGTDIGTIDMVKMGWLQGRLKQEKTDRILLTGEPQMIDGISYVVQTDPDRNEQEIAKFMGAGETGT